jgi:hypothetical protein
LFVRGLHSAMWVSGLALFAAAALVALLFSRHTSETTRAHRPP